MSDYTQITDFSAKDALTTGDPEKIILGADVDAELSGISTAIATKYDSADLASQAQAEAGTNNATLMTPLRARQENAAWVLTGRVIPDAALQTNVPLLNATNTFTGINTFNNTRTRLLQPGATADNGLWDFIISNEAFAIRAINDADTVGTVFLRTERTGTTVDSVALTATAITLNGALDLSGAATIGGSLTASSGAFNVSGTTAQLSSTQPVVRLVQTDAPTDEKQWVQYAFGGDLRLGVQNDAQAGEVLWGVIQRTGTTIDEIELNATTFDLNGALELSGTLDVAGNAIIGGWSRVSGAPSTASSGGLGVELGVLASTWTTRTQGLVGTFNTGGAIGALAGDLILIPRTSIADTGVYLAGSNGTNPVQVAMFTPAEIQLDATLLDLNGNVDISGSLVLGTDLAVAQGGTGASTLTGLLQGNGTGAITGGATINDGNWSGTDLAVANGGSGASTLTGLLQGNGTSAFTGITNSSTVGQVLRVTGASTYAWGALDLADADAITGDIPDANLSAQVVLKDTAISSVDNGDAADPGYRGTPQNVQDISYTLVLADCGKTIYKSAGGAGETITVPANASVAFPVGTIVRVINNGGGDLSIAITTDILSLAGSGTTGTRTLSDHGVAVLEKVATTEWFISGIGVS